MRTTILVATHKKYQMPNDSMYLPVHVGAQGKQLLGYQPDNEGENISTKNPYYCELTGLYWAWKNLDSDYIGLVHYRRYFKGKKKSKDLFEKILTSKEVDNLLRDTDVILPRKQNYYIETIYSHYSHTHYEKDIVSMRNILKEMYPDYVETFDEQMSKSSAHMFNMFIMKRNLYDQYCEFIFSVLEELEKRVDISDYSPFQARLFGRMSELLLDVWLTKNHIEYTEVPVLYMEKINWSKKIISFLKAKFFRKKYTGSF